MPVHASIAPLDEKTLLEFLGDHSQEVFDLRDLDSWFRSVGSSRLVLLGEASHGTHEYHRWRNLISQKLVQDYHFQFVAVEADWSEAYALNRYIKDFPNGRKDAHSVLSSWKIWPSWMWANWETAALGEWLRTWNSRLEPARRVGFYGLDVYGLWESLDAIRRYLEQGYPQLLSQAKLLMQCMEPFRAHNGRAYAQAVQVLPESCENELMDLLQLIKEQALHFDGDSEQALNLEQHARVALHAEAYFRHMIRPGGHSWNIRDQHMAETLKRLLDWHGEGSRGIVWAHNSHIGDARATDMTAQGMLNLGELCRMTWGDHQVRLLGLGSYRGQVLAASAWNGRAQTMDLPPSRTGSWDYLLHRIGMQDRLILMDPYLNSPFAERSIDQRAVGVVYQPRYEAYSSYVPSILPLRYDAYLFVHQSKALHALESGPAPDEVPETYPYGV